MPQPLFEIVGVVKDTKYTDLREPFSRSGSFAASQADPNDVWPFLQVVLRSDAPLTTITPRSCRRSRGVNPVRSSCSSTRCESQVRESLHARAADGDALGILRRARRRCIATIGLYGVMSYMVARRRNEIGIRMALGADRGDVVRMVMREAGILLAAGVIVGRRPGCRGGAHRETLLFGLQPGDPATLAIAAAGLGLVAMLASYLPALRASRLEPTEALREE